MTLAAARRRQPAPAPTPTRGPSTRWRRRPSLLILALGCAAAAAPALAAPALASTAPATPGAHPAPTERRVVVRLTTLQPVTVTPGRTLRVAGTLDVRRGPVIRDAVAALEVAGSPVTARSAVANALADPGFTTPIAGAQDKVGDLRTGERAPFRIRVDTDVLPLGLLGAYPLRVVVSGTVRATPSTVGALTTLLPWEPAPEQVAPTRLLWLWPLVDRPRRDFTGAFVDDGLATELAPGGRLYDLVSAAAGRPVSWVVDPALLADASAMSGGYQVRSTTSTDPLQKGTGSDAARQWLESFSGAAARRDVAVLPYSDVDVGSVLGAQHAGLLRSAVRWGAQQARTLLGRPVRRGVAWPVDGVTDLPALTRMPRAGLDAVLLSGGFLPPSSVPAYTPSGRTKAAEGVTALLSDPTLDELVASPSSAGNLLARQRFLAETLLITAELPTTSRLVVVAPPRRWAPRPGYARTLLEATARAAWLRTISLDGALRWAPASLERIPVPTLPPPGQLPEAYVDQAATTEARLRSFAGILSDPKPVAADVRGAVLGSLSTAWRDDQGGGLTTLTAASQNLQREMAKVRIVSRGGTVTSNRGTLPLTVVNELDQPVQVGLSVTASDPLRLQIDAPNSVRIAPGGRVSVNASVDATTSGNLSAQAQLVTTNGRPYSDPVRIDVRVRAYGQVALIVFGAAAALLVVAALVRIARRITRHRAQRAA